MNKAKIAIVLKDLKVESQLQFREVNSEGLAMLMAHLGYMLRRIQEEFDKRVKMVARKK